MDPLAHLVGRLVGKGDAQNIAGQDAHLVDQISEPVRQSPGLTGARPGDDTDEPLRGGDGLSLGRIQLI